MAGLLGQNGAAGGLLGVNRGATPESIRRRQEEERRAAILAQPQRPVMGAGESVLGFLLGGTEGVHQTRERRRAEAMRPQQMALQQEILDSITDPRERALFLGMGGESWQENAGHQLRPRTLAPGSIERINGETVAASPIIDKFDDRYGFIDPLNPQGGAQYTDPRGPTRGEETDRFRAQEDARQFGERLGLDREKLAVDAELGRGGLDLNRERLDLDRSKIEGETRQAEEDRRRAETEARTARLEAAANMGGALGRARQFLGASGVWAARNPLQAQARANLDGNLDTLRSNLTFENLAAMKAASPAGGSGMGALSDNEGRLLASTAASLSVDMSPQELERSLEVIEGLIRKMEQDSAPAASGGITREQAIAELRRRGRL